MGKISGQNSVIRLFHEYRVRFRKFSKTIITREKQRIGTNPFRVLLVSPGPIYGQNMSLIGDSHLGTFPRKLNIDGGKLRMVLFHSCSFYRTDML